jgi:hypothetical protein
MQQHEAELARRAQMGQGGGMDPRAQQMMAHQQQLAQMGGMGPKGPGFTGGFQPGPNGPQMGGRMGMFGQQAMGGARPQVPWMSQGPGGMKPQMRPMGGGMAGPMAGPRRMY